MDFFELDRLLANMAMALARLGMFEFWLECVDAILCGVTGGLTGDGGGGVAMNGLDSRGCGLWTELRDSDLGSEFGGGAGLLIGVWGVWILGPATGSSRGTDACRADASIMVLRASSHSLCLIDDQEFEFKYTVKSKVYRGCPK